MTKIDFWSDVREQATVLPCGLKVLKDTTNSERVTVKMWKPRGTKPFINYWFTSEAKADECIARQVESHLAWKKMKDDRKADRKGSAADLAKVQVGSIFCNSWGYDQTNVDFYQVIAIKGRTLTLREVGQSSTTKEGMSSMSDYRTAVKDSFIENGKTLTKRVQFMKGEPYISMNHGWCDLWDGKPQYCSWYA